MTYKEFQEKLLEDSNYVLITPAIAGYGIRANNYSPNPSVNNFLEYFDVWGSEGVSKGNKSYRCFELPKEMWDMLHSPVFVQAFARMGVKIVFEGEDVIA